MLPTCQQWSKWTLPSKYGALGLLVGVASLVVTVWAIWTFNISADTATDERRFHNLLFQSAHELKSTRAALCDLSNALDRLADSSVPPELPVGRPKLGATVELVRLYHNRIMKRPHGEEEYIFQLVFRLSDASKAIEQGTIWEPILRFDHSADMSVVDVLFLASFLNWYIRPLAEETLTKFELYSLGWYAFPGRNLDSVCKVEHQNLRFFRNEGKPITEFSEYLGLID